MNSVPERGATQQGIRHRLGLYAMLAVIVAVSLVSCWPGLRGTWVYDDLRMVGNPLYDDWQDVAAVFRRTSTDYLGGAPDVGGATYRPVTMLTLIATHASVPKPWAHHILGWLAHLATAAILFFALRDRSAERSNFDWVALGMALFFLLHPIGVEAYVWINGRSDLVAGAFLATLAWLRPDRRSPNAYTWLAWAAIGFLGAASKLPFCIAAVFLWLGSVLRTPHGERHTGAGATGVGLLTGMCAFVVLHHFRVSSVVHFASGTNILGDHTLWSRIPRLIASGAAALLSFRPDAMQMLAWSSIRPWTVGELIGGLAIFAFGGALVLRRDWGGVCYGLGAALTLAPAIAVSRALWLGFDRYMYMPTILLMLCTEPYVRRLARRLSPRARRLALGAGVLLLALAGVNTHLASRAYASHLAFLEALAVQRPTDPATQLFLVQEVASTNRAADADRMLVELPDPPWPQAVVIPWMVTAKRLDNDSAIDRVMSYAAREFDEDPLIRAHAMRWHYENGRFDDALRMVDGFPATHPLCVEVRGQLEIWARGAGEVERQRLRLAAKALAC